MNGPWFAEIPRNGAAFREDAGSDSPYAVEVLATKGFSAMTTVLITGANRGIGLALVRQYLTDKANVIACCREPAKAAELNDLAAASGGRVRVVQLEVGETASIASLKEKVGDQPIDVVINNAAVNGTPKDQSAARVDPENWVTTMRINALGPVLISQALIENLKRGAEKKLVAISSCYGSTGKDYGAGYPSSLDRYAYRASKAALHNGMCGLARDWAADGILVGILDPGFVRTDMPGEIARNSPNSISADESASGIKDRVSKLTKATSGAFQRFWGEPIPW
jgi:NAD(P)-dependent dehydrogenase (short-subunit alcohol dehydrogenase family)